MTPEQQQDIQDKLDRLTDLVKTSNAEAQDFVMRNRVVTCKHIIDKFCDGPVQTILSMEAVQSCRESTTLQGLIETVSQHMDFDSEAQGASFILNYLDYETD
jgi:hypothetical protein